LANGNICRQDGINLGKPASAVDAARPRPQWVARGVSWARSLTIDYRMN
jgi:hypothetical protein